MVVSLPLPKDGDMEESMQQGNFPRPEPEVMKRKGVPKERAAQTVDSWTEQNEMRGVFGRVSTGAA